MRPNLLQAKSTSGAVIHGQSVVVRQKFRNNSAASSTSASTTNSMSKDSTNASGAKLSAHTSNTTATAAVTTNASSSARDTNGPLVLSEKGAEEMLALLKKPGGANLDIIRQKIYPSVRAISCKTSLPYTSGPNTVLKFGLFPPSSINSFHNSDFLFPSGYCCR